MIAQLRHCFTTVWETLSARKKMELSDYKCYYPILNDAQSIQAYINKMAPKAERMLEASTDTRKKLTS